MRLSALAQGWVVDGGDPDITSISEDSRRVQPGALFVAVAGSAEDGHGYIGDAVSRGAAAIAAERIQAIPAGVARLHVPDSRAALAAFASRFYGHPARDLRLIGFTGTFGKTSTSEILRALLALGGGRPAVLGSLGAKFATFHDPGRGLTTPAPVELHRALRDLRDAGADSVIMEVTSHALRMQRVSGLTFSGGLLAAIKPGEHTDYHRSYEDYVAAKRIFLDYLADDAILAYDADNRAASELASSRSGRGAGFSLEGRDADLMFTDTVLDADGARFVVDGPLAGGRLTLRSALLGSGNLRNVALALTYALAHGADASSAARVLESLVPLPRRMERFVAGGRTVLDDTAAHPDSFRATFDVASLLPHRRLVVVYALRGSRGAEINARNAQSLADLADEHRAEALIVTASSDAAGPVDRVIAEEAAAATDALTKRGRAFVMHDTLRAAIDDARDRTDASDLIVLIGAQGMNRGRAMLEITAEEM